jgi:hypothetical protein
MIKLLVRTKKRPRVFDHDTVRVHVRALANPFTSDAR